MRRPPTPSLARRLRPAGLHKGNRRAQSTRNPRSCRNFFCKPIDRTAPAFRRAPGAFRGRPRSCWQDRSPIAQEARPGNTDGAIFSISRRPCGRRIQVREVRRRRGSNRIRPRLASRECRIREKRRRPPDRESSPSFALKHGRSHRRNGVRSRGASA